MSISSAPARVSGLFSFTAHLTKARFASRQGESLLYLAAIMAFIISSALALTVAGGTWMFYYRWQHPHGLLLEVLAEDSTFDIVPQSYFILAVFACALLIPATHSLASGAAVLGARGRERRLAALRLLGLSSGDVTRMALIDTLVQATIGVGIGAVIYLVTLPLWSRLTMLGMPLSAEEMLLPWPLTAAICVAVIGLGVASAWWGLRQVRISPLGVARLGTRPRLKAWRIVLAGLVLIAGSVAMSVLPLGSGVAGFLLMAGIIVIMIQGFNIAGPWLLQQISKLIARAPRLSVIWAARRIEAHPKQTWQRVVGISLLALIGGYMALMPIEINGGDDTAGQTFVQATQWDFTKGVIITLAVGFTLTAASIFITQASAVFERAEQTIAMYKMGAPLAFSTKVMWLETLGPLVFSVVLGAGLGAAMAYPMYRYATSVGVVSDGGPIVMAIVLIAGIVLAMVALWACRPLQRRVLATQHRAND
ncbi:MAG: FtsX-like permease family protein [Propionibacterium sp.]|nr:FtsX-like permease family protein [Propionibacterium sp.]